MFSAPHAHLILVYFPLVLLPVAIAIQCVALVKKQDLASTQSLSLAGFILLIFGTIAALVAATFGDMALNNALSHGFPIVSFEKHELLAMISTIIFVFLTITHGFIRWSRFSLSESRGWFMVSMGIFAVLSLLITAYFGGQLVHEIGLNVAIAEPNI